MRFVIVLLKEMGIEIQERDVDRSEFYDASEAFFCGTGWEITPINEIDGSPVGSGSRRSERYGFAKQLYRPQVK